ncbi:MAG: hypothetical protein DRG27_00615 [Deltaproteobacteria bacterium]|nr:MAG: hypothetical protein DRG27_00615 [Deltaproteobacteria bacterium]
MNLLQSLKNRLDEAKNNKEGHISYLNEMDSVYNAEYPKRKKHSSVVVRDARNSVKSLKHRLVNDFTKREGVVITTPMTTPEMVGSQQDNSQFQKLIEKKAEDMKTLLEHYFLHEFNNFDFIRDTADVLLREGTAVIKTGWLYDFIYTDQQVISVPEEQVQDTITQLEQNGYEVKGVKEDGENLRLSVAKKVVLADRPDAVLVKNKDFFINKTATGIDDARFVIEKFVMNLSDIRKLDVKYNPKSGIFKDTDKLVKKIAYDSLSPEEKSLYGSKYLDTTEVNEEYDLDTVAKKLTTTEVTIYRFIGEIDADEDGVEERREIYYTKDTILYNELYNSTSKFPYIVIYLDKASFEKWGESFIIEGAKEFQKTRSAILRSIVDWLATLPISQKFINLDMLASEFERKKLQENLPASQIFVHGDPRLAVQSVTGRDFPQALPYAFNMFGQESQKNTGVNDMWQSGNAPSNNTTATEVTIAANSSQATYSFVFLSFANGLTKLFRQWIDLINENLSDEETINAVKPAGSQNSVQPINVADIKGLYKVEVSVTASGLDQIKINQLIQSLQMSAQLIQTGAIPPTLPAEIYRQMEELLGHNYVAKKLEEWISFKESTEYQEAVQQEAMMIAQQYIQQMQAQGGGNGNTK